MYKLLALTLLAFSLTFQQGPAQDLPRIVCKVYADDQWVEQELEKRPEFGADEQALWNFIGQHVRYLAAAQRAKVSGVVLITAEVTEDGQLVNEKIEKDPGAGLGQEALLVVQLMPDEWTPGTLDGKPVRVQVTIPITFRLM